MKLLIWILFAAISCKLLVAVTFTKPKQDQEGYKDWKKIGFASRDSNDLVAWAAFNNQINKTGWSFLEVSTSPKYDNDLQAYAAGWVEGQLTRDLMSMTWVNIGANECKDNPKTCEVLDNYVKKNTEWIQGMIAKHPDDPYWEQVKLFYYQVSGLIDGYNNVTQAPRFETAVSSLFYLQVDDDRDAIQAAVSGHSDERWAETGHCSALVKVLPGLTDLYVAQDTWTEFSHLLRMLKKYTFNFHMSKKDSALVPVTTMTFSSHPGSLTSGDDFYVLSNGLVTIETTIGNGNNSRWKFVKPQNSVLEGIRSMVANRLATNGKSWTKIFSQYNSGTYNNEWLVVDYNKFTPGEELEDGTLYVLDQIPGMIESADLTHVLRNQTYFPSYNSAYFPKIFEQSGGPDSVKKYGDWFSYDRTPRANIFRRDHVKVKDVKSMTKLMRYNNFKHDPLSQCNCTPPYSGENAISSRSDLNPANGTYPFGALGHRPHGGIDMKLTTSTLRKTLDFIAVCSPTYDDVPAFQWSTSDYSTLPHVGHPDLWNFKPITTKWGSGSIKYD